MRHHTTTLVPTLLSILLPLAGCAPPATTGETGSGPSAAAADGERQACAVRLEKAAHWGTTRQGETDARCDSRCRLSIRFELSMDGTMRDPGEALEPAIRWRQEDDDACLGLFTDCDAPAFDSGLIRDADLVDERDGTADYELWWNRTFTSEAPVALTPVLLRGDEEVYAGATQEMSVGQRVQLGATLAECAPPQSAEDDFPYPGCDPDEIFPPLEDLIAEQGPVCVQETADQYATCPPVEPCQGDDCPAGHEDAVIARCECFTDAWAQSDEAYPPERVSLASDDCPDCSTRFDCEACTNYAFQQCWARTCRDAITTLLCCERAHRDEPGCWLEDEGDPEPECGTPADYGCDPCRQQWEGLMGCMFQNRENMIACKEEIAGSADTLCYTGL
jgi:hypothetical protein